MFSKNKGSLGLRYSTLVALLPPQNPHLSLASSPYKILGREGKVSSFWVDSKKNPVELRNLCDPEYYGKWDKTAILFFSRFSAETSWSEVKPPVIALHGAKQQGSVESWGEGAAGRNIIHIRCDHALFRPRWKDYFSIVSLHPVFMRSGCLEPLGLHIAREIRMTNFKLVNCAQDCPLMLLSSVFSYSVLPFFPPFFLFF